MNPDSEAGQNGGASPGAQEKADILESISEALFAVDAEWRLTYVNGGVEALWNRRREDLLGRRMWEIFPEAVGTPLHDAMHRAMRERQTVICEAPSAVTGGWLRGAYYPSRTGLSAYLRDITEQKLAEEALRDNRERLGTIFNQVSVGIALTDPAGRFVLVNQRYCDILGRPMDDVIGRRMEELTHHEDASASRARFQRLLEIGQPYVVEKRYVRPDGAPVWVNNHISLTRDVRGKPQNVVAVVQDITERKYAEAALRESEQRYRATFDQAAAGIAHVGLDGRWLAANDRVCAITGYSRDELLRLTFQDITHPDDLEADLAQVDALLARRIPTFSIEKRYIRKDKSIVWVRLTASLVHDERGVPQYFISVIEDVSRVKMAEAAMREMNETLERMVEERTRELQSEIAERQKIEAALQQAQRLEAIGQLTGGVAHDFNNLLTVAIGQADSIIEAAGGDERITNMAAAIQRVAERGARLTSQLLAFSRRQRLRPETLIVRDLMESIGDLVRRAVGEAVAVETAADQHPWPSLIDPAQFESAILNLAVNARDAMPEGGRLTIATRNATVEEAEAQRLDLVPGDYVVVSVSDTGGGMPEEVQRRCFEPFFTTKDVGKGTGLGLSQVYGFARQSGGTATIESAVGRGTSVALYLPRAASRPVGDLSLLTGAAAVPGQGKTILLVEDQEDVREVIGAQLRQLGHRILSVPNGRAARSILEGGEPVDLLLTDIVMPHGVNGIELARWARRLRQDLKVMLVSGYSRQTHPPLGDEFVFLEKPFRQTQLASAIAVAFSEKRK